MASTLVDTDIVSFLFKDDSRAAAYLPFLKSRTLVISFMTLAELDRWAIERKWGERTRARMESFLGGFLVQPFERVLCRYWAEVVCLRRRIGRPIADSDAWIAATALVHGIPLVTHNERDFQDIPNLQLQTANERS